ncbi:phospholipid phosphatase-related protein type 5 isoform X1 [Triplophysa dalaica]|uniref:phospholipid phosphatase-related protein type 5 isoform X1 n=2 Tax=Triplophysa dalaica TaxID=1582913 RepID=UPI0024DF9585|nr:phospholipid phosphatase-related protein type 5 isoform X1 [Triplophysa dalaica]XP_056594301.1 phospholipid phosphatase-related protein type 5 isoform X1 [Triplophysa dalaica]
MTDLRSRKEFYKYLTVELVIMAGTVMLAYYFEYTDTFNVHVQGFFCYETAYTKPYLGPEDASAIPPALLYALVAGVPTLVITVTETALFLIQYTSKDLDTREKTIVTGDCCYLNPLVRRTFRFLGVYLFGLFTTDIFVNAGQVVTGNLAPHFLTVCKPNYTALGCQQALRYISHQEACNGNEDDILRARKTFPSKEAALSVYAAVYLAMYITFTVKAKGTRLAKPVMSLGLMCLAFLTGINRVAEYRNHWSDVIAGFIIGVAIAIFLVVCVVHNFKGGPLLSEDPPQDHVSNPMVSSPRVESPMEKYIASQVSELRMDDEELSSGTLKERLLSFFSWIAGKNRSFRHLQSTRQ